MAQSERAVVRLKYLGTAGWEITDGRTVVLVDTYLSRLRRVTPNDTVDPADNRPLFDNTAIAQSDTATIDAHIKRADFVLITHTHYDHALDAPYIASKTGATIIGTESTYHFARAQGVPAGKLIVVRGGEDYAFDGLSVRVIPSLHGVLRRAPNRRPDPNASLRPAAFPSDAKPPFRMGDLADRRRNTRVPDTARRASNSGVRVHELHRARNRRASARCRPDWSDAGATRDLSVHRQAPAGIGQSTHGAPDTLGSLQRHLRSRAGRRR